MGLFYFAIVTFVAAAAAFSYKIRDRESKREESHGRTEL